MQCSVSAYRADCRVMLAGKSTTFLRTLPRTHGRDKVEGESELEYNRPDLSHGRVWAVTGGEACNDDSSDIPLAQPGSTPRPALPGPRLARGLGARGRPAPWVCPDRYDCSR